MLLKNFILQAQRPGDLSNYYPIHLTALKNVITDVQTDKLKILYNRLRIIGKKLGIK